MGNESPDAICSEIASRDLGILHAREARAVGLSARQISIRRRSGRFIEVLPSTFRIAGAPDGWGPRAMAAVKWAGPHAALSGRASARARGTRSFEDAAIEVSTVSRKRSIEVGFRLRRCDDCLLEEIERLGPLPVTTPPKTCMDLFGDRDFKAGWALDQFLRKDMTLGEAWLFYEKEWIRGRRGVALMRASLVERTPGLAPTDEDLAAELLVLIRKAGLEEPVREFPFRLPSGRIRFDLAYPSRWLAIEADSFGWHGDLEAFNRDRQRDAEAGLAGWSVLRFTWAQIRFQPDYVVDMIKQHLEARP